MQQNFFFPILFQQQQKTKKTANKSLPNRNDFNNEKCALTFFHIIFLTRKIFTKKEQKLINLKLKKIRFKKKGKQWPNQT